MKKMSKIISAVTALCLTGCLLPSATIFTSASNYSDEETLGDLSYQKVDEDEDGTYDYIEIIACDQSAVSVDIPAEIDGLPVTSIGGVAFESCTSLTSVNIPDSVTYIASAAFSNCTSLKKITIPNSVTSIASVAFEGCTSLTSIALPDSVTSIGIAAFHNCTSLTSITLPDSITLIVSNAFEGCTSLTSVNIPDSVTSIESNAFSGCSSLKSINIPDSVTSIGDGAFAYCTSLESITILNPDCEIYDNEATIIKTATIYGYTNSTAQAYAEKYNRKFVSLDAQPEVPSGDVNGDDKINIFDAVSIAQYTVGKQILTDEQLKAADVDHNEDVNIFDAVLIAKYTLGIPFPE